MTPDDNEFKELDANNLGEEAVEATPSAEEPVAFDSVEEFCSKNTPAAAILCIPSNAGATVTKKLVDCGIKAFWNFSHYNIHDDFPDVLVENVHLNDSLMTLCYNITNSEEIE